MIRIDNVKCVMCILEQILFCVDLVNVPRKSGSGYLGHIVYVCMLLHCGIPVLIQLNA